MAWQAVGMQCSTQCGSAQRWTISRNGAGLKRRGKETDLNAAAALRELGVAVHPTQAVHVHRSLAQALPTLLHAEPCGRMHAQVVVRRARLDEGPVEVVPVVSHVDRRLHL